MAKRTQTHVRHLPAIYPDSLRPPPDLPDADRVRELGLPLSEPEFTVIRMAMAIHTASRQPKLTWRGWHHIAVACAIGVDYARKASGGQLDTPLYRQVMTPFLRHTGFVFLNKDDRAAAVRMLPHWDEIDAWRAGLSVDRQRALNNPREVERVYHDDRRRLGDPDAKPRPATRKHRQFPTLLEQMEALAEQLELANERAESAERESAYFAAMMNAVARQAGLDDDAVSEIRARVRALHDDGPPEDEEAE